MENKCAGNKIILLFLIIVILFSFAYAVRLPIIGSDTNNWGVILNNYLKTLAGNNATELNQTMVNGTRNIYDYSINGSKLKHNFTTNTM